MNPTVAEYGADPSSLICGFDIGDRADAAAREIDAGLVWLHFNWLMRRSALARRSRRASIEFYDSLCDGIHSTRIERADQSLIAVINDVHFDFAFEPSDTCGCITIVTSSSPASTSSMAPISPPSMA